VIGALVQAGLVNDLPMALEGGDSATNPPRLADAESVMSLAFSLGQRGRAGDGLEMLHESFREGSPYCLAVGALLAAANGEGTRAAEYVETLFAGHGTYLDRTYGSLALALLCREDWREQIAAARSFLASTEDMLALAVVALAEEACAEAVGDPDRSSAHAQAQAAWAALGLDPVGWRSLFVSATSYAGFDHP
jgi:hypothetical protein